MKDISTNDQSYVRPPGSTFDRGYQHHAIHHTTPSYSGQRESTYHRHHQYHPEGNQNYHQQQIYHSAAPEIQHHQQIYSHPVKQKPQKHDPYHEEYVRPVVHSLPRLPAGPYKQPIKAQNNRYVPQYEDDSPQQYTTHRPKPKPKRPKNLSRQQLLKQRLNKVYICLIEPNLFNL